MKYHEKAVKSRELEWKHNGMKDKGNTATKIDYGIVMSYLDASHVPHCHKDDDSPFNYYEKCMFLFYFFFFDCDVVDQFCTCIFCVLGRLRCEWIR